MSRDIIESCDAPGCSQVRNWKERPDNHRPPKGWVLITLTPPSKKDHEDRHIHLACCSPACAHKVIGSSIERFQNSGDLSIDVCFGHSEGEQAH